MNKMRAFKCPQCDADISETHEDDVEIWSGGWYCEACDVAYPDEDEDD